MSNNNTNKSNIWETVMYAVTLGTVIITQAMAASNSEKKSDNTNEIRENVYHIHTTPFVDPKYAKDYAKVSAKIQEAQRETDEYWKAQIARDISLFVRNKDDYVKAYAVTELSKIANNTKDWFWRRAIMEQIDEI